MENNSCRRILTINNPEEFQISQKNSEEARIRADQIERNGAGAAMAYLIRAGSAFQSASRSGANTWRLRLVYHK